MTMVTSIGEALARPGPMLAIVNTPWDDPDPARRLFDRIRASRPLSSVWAIADAKWKVWLEKRGVDAAQTILALDADGRPLELNYFLESVPALLRIRSHAFTTVVGAVPHSLHNEEVKLPFEERVCAFVAPGVLVAHTLPLDYAYLFDLPMLLRRCGRSAKVADYQSVCRRIVDDLYREWSARSSAGDANDVSTAIRPLSEYLPAPASSLNDEEQPLDRADVAAALAPLVEHAHRHLHTQLQHLTDTAQHYRESYEERVAAVSLRDQILTEMRIEGDKAVELRDAIISELRGFPTAPLDSPIKRRWRKLLSRLWR